MIHYILVILISTITYNTSEHSSTEDWLELFNGNDLNGWTIKINGYELGENYANTFRVEDGLLKVRYDEYETFDVEYAHIFYENPYSYYKLELVYRFIGEQVKNGPGWAFRNNGIMFHSQSPQSMLVDQEFPNSIEFQLLGGDGNNTRSNGNVCTPGMHVKIDGILRTQHCIESNGPAYNGDQWETAELIVHGNERAVHQINGEVVLEYTEPQLDSGQLVAGGFIAIQGESHPIDIQSIRLLNLKGCMDVNATNYKDYYVKHDSSSCQY